LNRREFVRHGSVVAALLAMGRLPVLARTGDTLPAAVEPVTGFLAGYAPPAPRRLRETYRLMYDIVLWHERAPATGITKNGLVGRVDLRRVGVPEGVRYSIDEVRRYAGIANRLTARLTCAGDRLGSLRAWESRASWRPLPDKSPLRHRLDALVVNGRKEHDRVLHSDGRQEDSARPLASLWSLIDFVARRGGPATDVSLDLLADLSSVSPGARLRYDGPVEVEVAGKRLLRLASYVLTGRGILPTNYLVDEPGLPQLVTVSMVSYALREVRAVDA